MFKDVQQGKTYCITVKTVPCSITCLGENDEVYEILNATSAGQYIFVAPTWKIEVSQDDAIIIETFKLAGIGPIGLAGTGSSINFLKIAFVDVLPDTSEALENTLYFVPKADQSSMDKFDEYIFNASTSTFELVGSTALDLSNYVTIDTAQEISGEKTFTANNVIIPNTLKVYNIQSSQDGLAVGITGLEAENLIVSPYFSGETQINNDDFKGAYFTKLTSDPSERNLPERGLSLAIQEESDPNNIRLSAYNLDYNLDSKDLELQSFGPDSSGKFKVIGDLEVTGNVVAPNVVTTDTEQIITGPKKFSEGIYIEMESLGTYEDPINILSTNNITSTGKPTLSITCRFGEIAVTSKQQIRFDSITPSTLSVIGQSRFYKLATFLGSASFDAVATFNNGLVSTGEITTDSINISNGKINTNSDGGVWQIGYANDTPTTDDDGKFRLVSLSANNVQNLEGQKVQNGTWEQSIIRLSGDWGMTADDHFSVFVAPTENQHVANKKYVDDQIASQGIHTTIDGQGGNFNLNGSLQVIDDPDNGKLLTCTGSFESLIYAEGGIYADSDSLLLGSKHNVIVSQETEKFQVLCPIAELTGDVTIGSVNSEVIILGDSVMISAPNGTTETHINHANNLQNSSLSINVPLTINGTTTFDGHIISYADMLISGDDVRLAIGEGNTTYNITKGFVFNHDIDETTFKIKRTTLTDPSSDDVINVSEADKRYGLYNGRVLKQEDGTVELNFHADYNGVYFKVKPLNGNINITAVLPGSEQDNKVVTEYILIDSRNASQTFVIDWPSQIYWASGSKPQIGINTLSLIKLQKLESNIIIGKPEYSVNV